MEALRNPVAKLLSFSALLLAVFAAAALAGSALGPDEEVGAEGASHASGGMPASGGHGSGEPGESGAHGAEHGAGGIGGLSVEAGGLRLDPVTASLPAGRPTELAFRVVDEHGQPVSRGYQLESRRRLHLIVVRDDTSVYRHLHPELDGSGTWRVPLELDRAGGYRVIADFTIAGRRRSLATDLTVTGAAGPAAPFEEPRRTVAVGGYEVSLEAGGPLEAGREAELRFTVSRGGGPVRGLQPYLGAAGHLVALREGDLGYLHVHPEAGELAFAAEFPTPGRYRLFLEFRHDGEVHAVPFTVDVGGHSAGGHS